MCSYSAFLQYETNTVEYPDFSNPRFFKPPDFSNQFSFPWEVQEDWILLYNKYSLQVKCSPKVQNLVSV